MTSAPCGYPIGMSDFEHDLILEFQETRDEVELLRLPEKAGDEADELRTLARRALVAASSAQEAAYGRHDPWIDDAMRVTTSTN